MELRQIAHFVRVARLRSLSRAGLALGVSTSVLSREVRALERELGTPLLHRHGRGVRLTPAGDGFLLRAERALEELARGRGEAASAGRPRGPVVVGLPPSVGHVLALPLIERVRIALPEVRLRVAEGFDHTLSAWLQDGRVDLAIGYAHRPGDGETYEEPLVVIGTAALIGALGERVTLRDLAALPLVLPGAGHAFRAALDAAAAAAEVELVPVIEVDSFPVILRAARAGLGLAVVPRSAARTEGEDLRALPLGDPPLVRRLALRLPAHGPTGPAQAAVARELAVLAGTLLGGAAEPA